MFKKGFIFLIVVIVIIIISGNFWGTRSFLERKIKSNALIFVKNNLEENSKIKSYIENCKKILTLIGKPKITNPSFAKDNILVKVKYPFEITLSSLRFLDFESFHKKDLLGEYISAIKSQGRKKSLIANLSSSIKKRNPKSKNEIKKAEKPSLPGSSKKKNNKEKKLASLVLDINYVLQKNGDSFKIIKTSFQFEEGTLEKGSPKKIRDYRRIFDFIELETALFKYYNKYNHYPLLNNDKCQSIFPLTDILSKEGFIVREIKDPLSKGIYKYQFNISPNGQGYILKAILEDKNNKPEDYTSDSRLGCYCKDPNDFCVYNSRDFSKKYNVLLSAMEEYKNGHYQESLKKFQECLDFFPEDADIPFFTALTYLQLNQKDKAIDYFKRALEIDPNYEDALFQLGMVWMNRKAYHEALPYLEKLYKLQPKRPNLTYFLGYTFYNLGNYQEALKYFDKSLNEDKSALEDVKGLSAIYAGHSLLHLSLFNKAKTYYQYYLKKFSKTGDPRLTSTASGIIKEIDFNEKLENYLSKFLTFKDSVGDYNFSFKYPPEWGLSEFGIKRQEDMVGGDTQVVNYTFYTDSFFFRLTFYNSQKHIQALGLKEKNYLSKNVNEVLYGYADNVYSKDYLKSLDWKIKTANGDNAYLTISGGGLNTMPDVLRAFIFDSSIFDSSSKIPLIEFSFYDEGIKFFPDFMADRLNLYNNNLYEYYKKTPEEVQEKDKKAIKSYSIFTKLLNSFFISLKKEVKIKNEISNRDSQRFGDILKVQGYLFDYYGYYRHFPMANNWSSLKNILVNDKNLKISDLPRNPLYPTPEGSYKYEPYIYKSSPDGQNFVIGVRFEDSTNDFLSNDADGIVYGVNCNDPMFCKTRYW